MDEQNVIEVKRLLLANAHTQQQIADMFSVSRSTISNIATGRSHKDVEPTLLPVKIAGGQTKNLNLEAQNVSLIGQIANLRDERNLLKRQLKAASKRGSVVDSITEQFSNIIVPMDPVEYVRFPRKSDKDIEETLCLALSDIHADQVITPEEVDGLEEFNFPICMRRGENLVSETIKFSQQSLSNYRFEKLVLMGLGDYTSGAIHGHEKRSYFGEQFTNDLAIGEFIAHMIAELSQYFKEVEVINIIGNHGRLTNKIEFTKEAVASNHDTMIMKIAQLHCMNLKNVDFVFPKGLSHIHDVEGSNFYLHHGHGKAGGSDAYTRAKAKAMKIVPIHKGKIHYFVTGHFHTPGIVRGSGGANLIANGAFPACDQYSMQSIEEIGDPSQFIWGVHKRNRMTWRLPIQMRSPDEKDGPQRYKNSVWEAFKCA